MIEKDDLTLANTFLAALAHPELGTIEHDYVLRGKKG